MDTLFGENGMPTYRSSGSPLLDLFFKMGAARDVEETDLVRLFDKALETNSRMAVKAMFYNRDIRGGQGERRSFRLFFGWLCYAKPELAIRLLHLIPVYGRWDDLFVAFNTKVETAALELIKQALFSGDRLCAKWMPREGKARKVEFQKIINYLGLSFRDYRKLLSRNTSVVETQMSENRWEDINFSHVPSQAHNKYRKAFLRQTPARYTSYLLAVKNGAEKMNAGAIHPHEIIRSILNNNDPDMNLSAELQWASLPDYIEDGVSMIPVCDLSGSMEGLPMMVSVALGIYLSERNKGAFKDKAVAFSNVPSFYDFSGKTLAEKVKTMFDYGKIGWNTDLEEVFDLLLSHAVFYRVPAEEMPKFILILSDMQFDEASENEPALDMIKSKYEQYGYSTPNIIFWNLRDSIGVPAKDTQTGAALISGFSPSIMQAVLRADVTPDAVMTAVLNSPRYSLIDRAFDVD